MKNNTINKKEIEKFSKIASEWWDPNGKFKPLHKFNPTRIKYIKDSTLEHYKMKAKVLPFKKLKILDIGCGGGLLCEPMSRLGANVTGIDASENQSMPSIHSHLIELFLLAYSSCLSSLSCWAWMPRGFLSVNPRR